MLRRPSGLTKRVDRWYRIFETAFMEVRSVRAKEVFVAGGQPTVTYYERDTAHYEGQILDHLSATQKILSVSGPTKSGKTVLIRKVLGETVQLVPGAQIDSAEKFWQYVAFGLNIYSSERVAVDKHQEGGGGAQIEAGAFVKLRANIDASRGSSTSNEWSRDVPLPLAVHRAMKDTGVPIVVDDFHYIDRDVQAEIVRGVKALVFDSIPIILLSVPHRSSDVVRAEREMTGRFSVLDIPLWSEGELLQILQKGMEALKVLIDGDLAQVLARQASGSPHLMQEFCFKLCRLHKVEETQSWSTRINLNEDERMKFYSSCAETLASKIEFDRLVGGPKKASERKQRRVIGASDVQIDIYTAVFTALSLMGPQAVITYNQIREQIRGLLVASDVPAKHEITRVLKQLDQIAKTSDARAPVLEWDHEDDKLYISDPFFQFYVNWVGGGVY